MAAQRARTTLWLLALLVCAVSGVQLPAQVVILVSLAVCLGALDHSQRLALLEREPLP